MRPIALALLGLAFFAASASAAVIEIRENPCGCDGSSGDEDTRTLIVRAEPGELNRMTIRRVPRGVLIEDAGAPLSGACRLSVSGGRFCRGAFDGAEVELADGDDQIDHSDVGGSVDGGSGDDRIVVAGAPYLLTGAAGADRLDATDAPGSSVSYAGHTEAVTVRLNGVADDGAAGEGDNVVGTVTGLTGGAGDDRLEAGATASGMFGAAGNDTLVGSPERDTLNGGDGDDELLAGDGHDYLTGAAGADRLLGGPGLDEVAYGGPAPLRLSIGDGPNDGSEGEGDDIGADVESLTGGRGDDVLVGDEDGNRLIAYGGRDVLRGLGGPDELIGWDDGDELDAGAGTDRVWAGALDRPLLWDGERDRLFCRSRAPDIVADRFDVLRACAPRVTVAPRVRAVGRRLVLRARCPVETAVPCEGRLWLHTRRGRALSGSVHVGPIAAGGHERLSVRLRGAPPRAGCLYATARTRREDGHPTLTVTRSAVRCLG